MHLVTTSEANGLEHVVMDICNLVPKNEYYYVSPSGEIDDYLKEYGIKHIVVDKITPLIIRKVIKKYKPDIVNSHDVKASLSLAFNYSLCKKNNIKTISTLHNDDLRMHHIGLRSLSYNFSSKYYDTIVGVSKDVIDNYIFKSRIYEKTVVIDNVVNTKILNLLSKDKISSNFDFIFVGRFEEQKNPQRFIKLIEKIKEYFPNVKAVMLGQGSLLNDVTRLIREYHLEKNIDLYGFQKNPYKFIKKSKMMIIPSRYEGFGIVALEAMLLGKPVLASDVSGLRTIVNNDCGILTNDDYEIIHTAKLLLSDEKYYDFKAHNAKKRAEKINNLKSFVTEYANVYTR